MTTTNANDKKPEFKGFRALVWPIHNYELKKFLPMGIMMFCILFIYTVLRDTKDSIVANAPGSGAEAFAFIKGFGVTTFAVAFMLLYTKAANIFNREGLFYVTALPFLIFFGLFPYVIYPNVDVLHMSLDRMNELKELYPRLTWFIPVVGNWTYTLFYILSELWGSVILSLLFWQFANAITPVKEAKRFYGMFGFIGNAGLVCSGPAVVYFSRLPKSMGIMDRAEAWGMSLKYLMALVILAGIIAIATFYWMNRKVLTDKRYYNPEEVSGKKSSKPKLSIMESLKTIAASPYLGLIAVLVLAYGVSINLFEGVWKSQIKIAFPNENDFNEVMGKLSFVTGSIAMVLMLVGSNILRRFTWRTAALITPAVLLVGIMAFFGLILYNNSHVPEGMSVLDAIQQNVISVELIAFAVFVGLFINAFSKAVKYSLFDPTKEMAYIPLDPELKVKGKAAVDVIGGRGGKAGGAWIQVGLLSVFAGSTLNMLVPIIAPILILVVVLWLASVFGLSKKFVALTGSQKD